MSRPDVSQVVPPVGQHHLRISVFVPPVPHVLAERLGFLEDAGVQVELIRTTSSNEQQRQLAGDELDLAVTALDNLIVWNGIGPRIGVISRAEHTTALHVYARPGYDTIQELLGCRFAVDSATNGFAIVARHVLELYGVRDVEFPEFGGVKERLDALEDGRADATLLGPPFDTHAAHQGFVRLLTINELIPAFPGQGLVMRVDRRGELQAAVTAYLVALTRAVEWAEHVDEGEALSLLREAGFPGDAASAAWATRPLSLDVDTDGLELIVGMRRELGLLPQGAPSADSLRLDLAPRAPE